MHTYNTKYALGDEVYFFNNNTKTGELYIVRAKIEEIVLSKDSVKYYLDNLYEEVSEEDIILVAAPAEEICNMLHIKTERSA